MDQNDNPTPPAESASGTQGNEQGDKTGVGEQAGGARPSVSDLLAAARGDAVRSEPAPASERTPVTPPARRASSGTVSAGAPPGDAPGKSFPAATPPAARVAPASGASKTTSTPTPAVNAGVAKAVAVRPPVAGPLVQSLPDPSVNQLRRWIVWGSLFSFVAVLGAAMTRFFLPRVLFEPSSVFRIGYPGDYGIGVDTKWQQQYRIWVVRNTERLFVIRAVCTHLGCTPDWKASENKFKCPCHGSGYDSEGINFEGPAPRPMDRARVSLDATGQVVVDTNKLFISEKGKANQFDDEGAYLPVA